MTQTLLNHGQGLNKRFAWFDDQITKTIPASCMWKLLILLIKLPIGFRKEKCKAKVY